MANVQSRLGDITGAQEIATEAIRFLNKSKDSIHLSSAYNLIGISYREQDFPEDALREYENALRFSTSRENSLTYLYNIALVHQESGNYEAAVKILEEILKKVEPEDSESYSRYLDNLAYTKWLSGTEAGVEEHLKEALEIREKEKDQHGLLASYSHLSGFYQDENPSFSAAYAEKLLETSQKYGSATAQLKAELNTVMN